MSLMLEVLLQMSQKPLMKIIERYYFQIKRNNIPTELLILSSHFARHKKQVLVLDAQVLHGLILYPC